MGASVALIGATRAVYPLLSMFSSLLPDMIINSIF